MAPEGQPPRGPWSILWYTGSRMRGVFFGNFGRLTVHGSSRRVTSSIRATGDCPGTLIPLAGRLQYQGRYLEQGKANPFYYGEPNEAMEMLA